jgi:hypothetical protein
MLKRKRAAVILDLTETNPTAAGFNYPGELLEALSNPRALAYDPQPLGLWSARAAVASTSAAAASPSRAIA